MEALAVIAAAVALIWGAVVFLRGGLIGGCLAVLLAGVCFSVPFYKIELGPLPLTADRLLLVLLVVQYVYWRRWGLADPKPLGKPEILLLAFLAVLIVSTFTHDWKAENYQPVAWLVISYLMPATMYWIARQAKYSERTILVLFGGLAVLGVYLAVTTLAEYFRVWWLVFPRYIVSSVVEKGAEFVGRGRGPLLNPIANGILLTVGLGGALMWWPRLRRAGQLTLLAVSLLLLAALFYTLTRSVWMGGLFALALAVGLALPWNWRLPLLVFGLMAGVLLAVTQWDNLLAFKRDKALAAEKTAESVELRPILATIAWKMFLDRPLLGCGYAQYGTEHENYVSDRSTRLALERGRGYIPHNAALSLLTETGLIGLGLFAMMLFFWGLDAWRLWRDAGLPLWARQQGLLMLIVLGAYLINGMFHEVSVVPMANMTLFFLAGATAGLRTLTSRGIS
ncbi:MAG: O-antigen ligase family protein [Planctomycetes bacterium]|nr:O-antigen ligase family protein [Planctomycetota bacterium]MBU4398883.1 O-antigen ligase family protein [Planctomycetota bacterium]MCG2683757.1 O-antigen ligase family protein [Planctomycetales bacterium]